MLLADDDDCVFEVGEEDFLAEFVGEGEEGCLFFLLGRDGEACVSRCRGGGHGRILKS